ncbi:MAG: hypothetical protein ACYDEF_01000 [Methanosarcina sp.]
MNKLKKLDKKIEEKLDKKIEEKLDKKIEEKLDKKIEEKLDKKLEEKLDKKLEKKIEEKLDKKLEEKLKEKSKTDRKQVVLCFISARLSVHFPILFSFLILLGFVHLKYKIKYNRRYGLNLEFGQLKYNAVDFLVQALES